MGKLYEGMLAARLRNDVWRLGGLAETQYGFKAGRSTTDAMMDAREYARGANVGTWGTRRFCVMVTVDVRNAFNTVSWSRILERLVSMGVEPYLVNVVRSYLSDRVVQTEMGEFEMTAGVPQGSVLGPLLWNIFYDEVLRMEVPDGVKLIGYADDLAVIVRGKSEEDLRERTEEALRLVGAWMGNNGLSLAPDKSKAVLRKKKGQVRSGQVRSGCLTGHGCYMSYVAGIGKRRESTCMYCQEDDDVEHTLFGCHRWHVWRHEVEIQVGRKLTADNLIEGFFDNWSRDN
ncbi:hypothetical protein Zmor_006012 [Zophobas morio]|uniref:Reverse transcriptase domain-containing protein n=1 Tax=Zophobas morio TaxID=2755281 RepID=A0AA38IVH5_9CUCU|nr:hypothetical protein Zmor_006012 [Zophobas morio]